MTDEDSYAGGRFAWEWPEAREGDGPAAPSSESGPPPGPPPPIDYLALLDAQIAEAEERDRQRERLRRLRTLAAPIASRRVYPLDVGRQRGSSPPLSVRLPRWLEEQMRRELDRIGVTPSAALRQILEEWWVVRRYPALEFRGAELVRTAAVRGGPTVTEWVAADPRPPLADDVREQVLDYVELFRSRIEAELRGR